MKFDHKIWINSLVFYKIYNLKAQGKYYAS
jgi:hypothetical protein